jgi:hypothetical protein
MKFSLSVFPSGKAGKGRLLTRDNLLGPTCENDSWQLAIAGPLSYDYLSESVAQRFFYAMGLLDLGVSDRVALEIDRIVCEFCQVIELVKISQALFVSLFLTIKWKISDNNYAEPGRLNKCKTVICMTFLSS